MGSGYYAEDAGVGNCACAVHGIGMLHRLVAIAALPRRSGACGASTETHSSRMVPLSILDLAPITRGSDAGEALRRSRELAQHAERWG